jgi:hypothetical protein
MDRNHFQDPSIFHSIQIIDWIDSFDELNRVIWWVESSPLNGRLEIVMIYDCGNKKVPYT